MKILSFDIGIKNLSYCLFDYNPISNPLIKINHWNVINFNDDIQCNHILPRKKTKCSKTGTFIHENLLYCKCHAPKKSMAYKNKNEIFDLNKKIINKLDEYPELYDATHIVIENQPTTNMKMKTIAAIVFNYYTLRIGIDLDSDDLVTISYINPMHKITKIPYNGPKLNIQTKTKYQRYKQTAVKYASHYIQHDDNWIDFFDSLDKQDDLADSFLNGIAFIVLYFSQMKLSELQDYCNTKNIKYKRIKKI